MKNNVYNLDICFHRINDRPPFPSPPLVPRSFVRPHFRVPPRLSDRESFKIIQKERTCIFNNPPRSFALLLSSPVIIAPTSFYAQCDSLVRMEFTLGGILTFTMARFFSQFTSGVSCQRHRLNTRVEIVHRALFFRVTRPRIK